MRPNGARKQCKCGENAAKVAQKCPKHAPPDGHVLGRPFAFQCGSLIVLFGRPSPVVV